MAEKKSFFGRIFGFIWGVVITFYRVLIVISLVVFVGMLWTLYKGGPTPNVEDNVALVIWPAGEMVVATGSGTADCGAGAARGAVANPAA